MTIKEFQYFDWRKTDKVVFRGKSYKYAGRYNKLSRFGRWVDCEAITPEPEEQPIVRGAVVYIK